MHPAAVQLTRDVYEQYLKHKGYELVGETLRYPFSGGRVISYLRGCNSHNRDNAPYWSFQVDTRILFDGLDYDPETWPVTWMFGDGPDGSYSGGLYGIEDQDPMTARKIADDILGLTDRLLEERDATRVAFEWRLKQSGRK